MKFNPLVRITLALAVCFAPTAFSADLYVSPSGFPTGNGSLAAPWDLMSALKNTATVRPGDTLNLKGGTYKTSGGVYFVSHIRGESGRPIIIRPYGTERVIIDGGIQIAGPWVIFRDLEVTSSDTRRVSTQPGTWPNDVNQYVGFGVYAPNVKLINNIVHDEAGGISGWSQAYDNEYYGNIVYYNGWQEGALNAHGHGLYVQNQSGAKVIRDNVVFNQFDHGIHAYGSGAAFLNNIEIDGNISFGNGTLGKYYSRNILVGGGVVANNPIVTNNYTYFPPRSTLGGENAIGMGQGCTNLRLTGNYWVSNGYALALNKCTISNFSGNTFYGQTNGLLSSLLSGNLHFPVATPPTQNAIFVRPNRYEAGRSHVVVFNWTRSTQVSVDVSGTGLAVGDRYEVRDVQNLFGEPVGTGIYNGAPIPIRMTSTVIQRPVGNIPYPPVHTESEFQTFLVRKQQDSIQPQPTQDVTPPQVGIVSPTNGQTVASNISVTANASDASGIENVQFFVDGNLAGNSLTAAPYTLLLNVSTWANKAYSITAVARDRNGNSATSAAVTIAVQNPVNTEAVRSNGAPSGTLASGTAQATLSLNTDKPATCRFSTGPGTVFASMSGFFTTTGGTGHSTAITGLSSGGTYSRYVRCQTTQGVVNGTDFAITFSVAAAPSNSTPPAIDPNTSVFSRYIEAESGMLTNPMSILDWRAASGGQYIRSNTTNLGSVTLTVDVPKSGDYVLWGRILSGNSNFDSMWVSVDGGPEDLWDTAEQLWINAWQWTRVTGRKANGGVPSVKNTSPRIFPLAAGTHRFRFRSADSYTYLDRVFITNSAVITPQ